LMNDYRPTGPITDGTITLRVFVEPDAPAVTEACQDRAISRWTSAIPWPYREADARAWIAGQPGQWASGLAAPFAIVDAADGRLLGSVGLHEVKREYRDAAIGYWVAAPARGRGIATRAVELATDWAFASFDVDQLDLLTKLGNAASERVAQKAGYRYVADVRNVPGALSPTDRFDAKRWARSVPGRSARPWPADLDQPG